MALNNLFNVNGRAFVTAPENGAAVVFNYYADLRVDAVQHASGSITPILTGRKAVGSLRATPGFWTGTLTARLETERASLFRRAHDTGSALHIRVNYGTCNDPTDLNDYSSAVLLEKVYITDYATSGLTASQPSEVALVQETLTFTCLNVHFVTPIILRPVTSPFSSAEVMCLTTVPAEAGRATSRVLALSQALPSGSVPNYSLAWSDDDGITWSTVALDGTGLYIGTAEVSKIVVLGDSIIGMNFDSNPTTLWSIGLNQLVDGATVIPNLMNALGDSPGDLKIFGDYAYAPLLNGDIVRISKDLVTTLVTATGVISVGAFCVLDRDHFIFSTFDGTGSKLYETRNGVTRFIPGTSRDPYVANIVTRPDGYVIVAYIYGYVYGKPKDSDTFTLLLNTLATDCVNQIFMVSDLIGYAAGAYLYQTLDGGASWTKLATGSFTENTYSFVALTADKHRLFAGGSIKVLPIDYSTYIGVTGSNSGILVTA